MKFTVLLVIAGAAWLLFRWWRSKKLAARTEALVTQAGDIEQASAELQRLQERLGAAVQREDHPEAIRITERTLALAEERLGGDPQTLLPLLHALANFHDLAGQPERAIAALRRSVALREKFPALNADPIDHANRLAQLATWLLQRREHREAQRLIKREVALRRAAPRGDGAALLRAQGRLLGLNLEEPAMAEPLRQEVRALAQQLGRDVVEDQLNEAYAAVNEAVAEGRPRDAWPAAEIAALLAPVVHGPEHAITAVCSGNLAEMLRRNRRYEEAEARFRQLIAQTEALGADAPAAQGMHSVYNNMALLCDETGRAQEAAQWRQRQMAALQREQADPLARFNALNNLAVSQSAQGDDEAAAQTFAQALALSPDGQGVEPRIWAGAMNNYGATLVTLKRLQDAGRLYQQVVTQKKAGMDIPLPLVAGAMNGLGMVYDQLDQLPQAQDLFERALSIKERHLAADDVALETGRHNLGSVYARQGNAARAAELAAQVLASREKRLGANHPQTLAARANVAAMSAAQQQAKPATRAEVEALMQQLTGGELHHYATFDFGRDRDGSVSSVLVPEGESFDLQYKLQRALPAGWRCFVGSTRWLGQQTHEGKAELVAIHSASQFDCVRVARTDPANHGLETEDVIRTLEDYHRRFGIRILAAATDSVDFQVLRRPDDIERFAAELLEFCPDLETVSQITPMLEAPSRLVSLWWD